MTARVGITVSYTCDQLFRHMTLLQLIPRNPGRMTTLVLKKSSADLLYMPGALPVHNTAKSL